MARLRELATPGAVRCRCRCASVRELSWVQTIEDAGVLEAVIAAETILKVIYTTTVPSSCDSNQAALTDMSTSTQFQRRQTCVAPPARSVADN